MKLAAAVCLGIALALGAQGCGQKGPLYLPQHKTKVVTGVSSTGSAASPSSSSSSSSSSPSPSN